MVWPHFIYNAPGVGARLISLRANRVHVLGPNDV
jgi:hypothetical protein